MVALQLEVGAVGGGGEGEVDLLVLAVDLRKWLVALSEYKSLSEYIPSRCSSWTEARQHLEVAGMMGRAPSATQRPRERTALGQLGAGPIHGISLETAGTGGPVAVP